MELKKKNLPVNSPKTQNKINNSVGTILISQRSIKIYVKL